MFAAPALGRLTQGRAGPVITSPGSSPQKVRRLVRLRAVEPSARAELVRVWSAERCKRLDFTGLSGTPKITITTADSRAEQRKSAVQGGGEATAEARLGNRCSIP